MKSFISVVFDCIISVKGFKGHLKSVALSS